MGGGGCACGQYLGREKRTDVNKALPPISYEKLQQREAQAIAKAEEALARIGVGVSTTAQAIFDAVAKTYVLAWAGRVAWRELTSLRVVGRASGAGCRASGMGRTSSS